MRIPILIIFYLIAGFGHCLHAQDIRLLYDVSYPLNFNRSVPVGLEVVTTSGKHLSTRGYLKGKIAWRKLDIKVTGGYLKKGMLYIDNASKVIGQRKVKLDVYYKQLNIRKTLYLDLKFDGLQVADFKPRKPKERAARGGRISLFRKILSPKDGKNGRTGHDGSNGPALKVLLAMQDIQGEDILVVTVINKTATRTGTFLINPHKGHLLIRADGADGGDGGAGGPGVDDDISPSNGGNGGDGGKGGNGGYIEVIVTKETKPFLYCLGFSTEAGNGGTGGMGGKGGAGNNSSGNNGADGAYGARGLSGPKEYYKYNDQ